VRTAPGFGLRRLPSGRAGWRVAEVSSTPNGGASLMLSIPVQRDAPASADGGRSEDGKVGSAAGPAMTLRVIVIDDHAIVRRGNRGDS